MLWLSLRTLIYLLDLILIDRGYRTNKNDMKKDIHPKYSEIKITCSCGNSFVTKSTLGQDLTIEVCSACHPFYTGQQKIVDTAGRVDKFRKRFGINQ